MYHVSDAFLATLVRSHEVISYVDVRGRNNELLRLITVDGNVNVDNTASVRRQCTIQCIDPTGVLTVETANAIVSPFGAEVTPYRGIRFPDGTVEAVPLGVFRISKVSIKDGDDSIGGVTITIEGFDRSRVVSRDKFTAPYTVTQGVNLVDAIKGLLRRTYGETLTYNAIGTSRTVSSTSIYDTGDDSWDACTTLAKSLGAEIFFDVTGNVVIQPPVDVGALPAPHFSYVDGDNCTLLDIERISSDEPGFNGVVVLGESPGDPAPPVRGIAWDEEPTSVTYHLGPYGEVPMFHNDQEIKTTQDAVDTARSLLAQQLGFSNQLAVDTIVNPAYECGDVIQVTRSVAGVDDRYVLDAFSIPLTAFGTGQTSSGGGTVPGAQQLVLRQKRRVL